jgi:hypothetical protein
LSRFFFYATRIGFCGDKPHDRGYFPIVTRDRLIPNHLPTSSPTSARPAADPAACVPQIIGV